MAYNTAPPPPAPSAVELGEEEKEKLDKIDKIDHAIDNFSNEKIGGQKTFTQTVIAKGYKLHDGTPLKPVAVETIKNNRATGVLIANGDQTVTAARNLTWDGDTLRGINLCFNHLEGSGENLTNLPAEQVAGRLSPLTIPLGENGALAVQDDQLTLSFHAVGSIKLNGQTLADADSILVYDNSHNLIRKSTLQAFYKDYINAKIHQPAGEQNAIQFKKGATFGSSGALTFEEGAKTLTLKGQLSAFSLKASKEVDLSGPLICRSAHHQNINNVSDSVYEVDSDDYTILADVSHNTVCVVLPDAAHNRGRLLNVKAINSAKYTLRSHPLTIKSAGGLIDRFEEITIKMNTAVRCLQSDGENWWIISSRGS